MRPGERRKAARELADAQRALTYRLAAAVLEYPGEEQRALLPDVRQAAATLPEEQAAAITGVVDRLLAWDATEAAAEYVATFDLKRRHSLYLTYFAYGDTRKRGVALVEFKTACRTAGFEIVSGELPDHLGVVLELAAQAPEVGIDLMLRHRAGLELLRLSLLEDGSPWAGALTAVCATLPALSGDDREAVARLAAQGPPEEEVGLDPFAMPSTGAHR
ncbi:nitrate reductase molybdenum cofactor assembly chaperone [Isoptericola sp. b441]|uniref:Nitrate reductase molybdenum cofactor assembly chaperone n=1 Tax=Actinotalea lenta TaxID=3064654 RepID=A0ABT9D9B8_9CELL|nr:MULTISPECIES: nitrate reductase molybdenum cofactor assembly chaperone [unclassified Isoptericola]MDO8106718.1 nitrate reductase molybdenum cofactor assembly chaperone [Isoptericola sp. b441]MDO8121570.1 nitrate reductase molybdenum cofactor assembly chaperone [Isoptericola sp. b490]